MGEPPVPHNCPQLSHFPLFLSVWVVALLLEHKDAKVCRL